MAFSGWAGTGSQDTAKVKMVIGYINKTCLETKKIFKLTLLALSGGGAGPNVVGAADSLHREILSVVLPPHTITTGVTVNMCHMLYLSNAFPVQTHVTSSLIA